MELQIESRNVDMTPEWTREIEERMTKLQSVDDNLIHGRVTLTKNLHHNKSEQVAEALVVISLPGRHTITARKENKTFEEAIRAAFVAVQTELRKYRDRRGAKEIRNPVIPLRGVISKLFPEQGYGFILQAGGGEVYFHRNAVHDFQFEDLEDGTEVAFNVEEGEQGPQATTVNPVPPMPS